MEKELRGRIFELDSLRGVAALGVVLWHYTAMWQARPLNWLFAPFYDLGLILVDFFFVLSGFVIARAYWNTKRSKNFRENVEHRIARIYPLHFITLIVIVPLQIALTHTLGPLDYLFAHNDSYHFILNIFLLNRSSFETGFSWNAPAWSISTEIIINIFFFMLILMSKRVATIGMIICFLAAALAIAKNGMLINERLFGLVNPDIVRTTAGFFAGVFTYHLSDTKTMRSIRESRVCDIAFLSATTSLVLFMIYRESLPIKPEHISFTIFPLIVLTSISSHTCKRILNTKPLIKLGEWSYSIYLIHFPLLLATLLITTVTGYKAPYDSAWFVIAFLGAVIYLSSITYKRIEIPGKNLVLGLTGITRRGRPLIDQ